MKVSVTDKKLKKALETAAARQKHFGADMAKKLALRLEALEEAESLATFWPPKSLPERVHELAGKLKGTFTMDLKHPFRLLFKPVLPAGATPTASVPPEVTAPPDGGAELERWRAIKEVDVTGVEDTHG